MFEFAGDVTQKDVRDVLMDVLAEEGLIDRAEDNGLAIRVDVTKDLTPAIVLWMPGGGITAAFEATEIVDDYDVVIGCRFNKISINSNMASFKDCKSAEDKYYSWYQFVSVAKEFTYVDFYPYDYFD